MQTAPSADGTEIAFETLGSGPPLILVGGAFCDRRARTAGLPLAHALSSGMTVFCYDRRGRGQSGDTPPYAVAREVEDLAALLRAAGGRASIYGHSSGAVLAFEAAVSGLAIEKLALYEPPIVLGELRERMPDDMAARLTAALKAGNREQAVELFLLRAIGLPSPAVQQMKRGPAWANLEAVAHTLVYEVCLTQAPEGILARASSLSTRTLLIDGGISPRWLQLGAEKLAQAIPQATLVTLPDQNHDVDPAVLAPRLLDFFLA